VKWNLPRHCKCHWEYSKSWLIDLFCFGISTCFEIRTCFEISRLFRNQSAISKHVLYFEIGHWFQNMSLDSRKNSFEKSLMMIVQKLRQTKLSGNRFGSDDSELCPSPNPGQILQKSGSPFSRHISHYSKRQQEESREFLIRTPRKLLSLSISDILRTRNWRLFVNFATILSRN
jgi:hypothetical protein